VPKDSVLLIPSAHAEGKLTFPQGSEKQCLDGLFANDQVVFRYVDPQGGLSGYPWNPSGAMQNIAGICNKRGNVLGMMPHPERVFFRHQHPDWSRTHGHDFEESSETKESKDSFSRQANELDDSSRRHDKSRDDFEDDRGDGRVIFESMLEYAAGKF
jgi:hypothetical protein